VSYDEDGEGGSGRSFEGGRGGGRGRGGYGRGGYGRGGGNQQGEREKRMISPEAAAVNDSINNAGSWRELQTILEQQVRGMAWFACASIRQYSIIYFTRWNYALKLLSCKVSWCSPALQSACKPGAADVSTRRLAHRSMQLNNLFRSPA
jgi:hypothetical protein